MKTNVVFALAVKNAVIILFAFTWHRIAEKYNSILLQSGIETPVLFELAIVALPFIAAILLILICASEYFKNRTLDFLLWFIIAFYLLILAYVHFFHILTVPALG